MPSSPGPAYSNRDAQKIFRQAWQEGGAILTHHCRIRMSEREVDTNDLMTLSRTGVVADPPECDIKTGEWKYIIERKKPLLKAVFTIPGKDTVRILTVEN